MKRLLKTVGPFTLKLKRDRYRALVHSIIAQQISAKAAVTIWQRLDDLVGPAPFAPENLRHLELAQWQSIGITGQKAAYLNDLTQQTATGDVELSQLGRLDDESVIQQLIQIKGIGRWTAQMFLIFSLGRLDVLPTEDLAIKSAIRQQYELRKIPDARRIEKLAQPWRPYATVASWYLWQSLKLPI